uniref:Uncharacterized protein n=1 Tax=Cyclopterus lumpus TaxID=8103 RepID=A0A8C2YWL2_CYCLU
MTTRIPSNSSIKRGRGRPQGSKKMKVSVTDVNLTEQISNGGSKQSTRGRGRPKLTKHTVQEGSGDDHVDHSLQTQVSNKQASNEDSLTANHSPKKRGRPRNSLNKSTSENAAAKDLPNGGSDAPKARRGRPKGSLNRKSARLTKPAEKGRGRPKGSLNKKPPAYRVHSKVGPATRGKRGRPRKQPAKRGRPRKYPLPSPEELNKPKVWKPLGSHFVSRYSAALSD